MWPDNETTQDLIGFKVHADLIRSLVINQKLLPLTIGIFGDWGGGKTSIMKMLERALDPDNYQDQEEKAKYNRIACLYFNGWIFEGYDDAKSAILSSVLLQLGEHKRLGPKVRDKVVSLLKSVNWMRLARFGFKEIAFPAMSANLTGGASLIPTLASSTKTIFSGIKHEGIEDKSNNSEITSTKKEPQVNWEELIRKEKTHSGLLDVRSFRERFAKMIQDSDIDFLVVLIDDLDRCSPERIIDNLEAIKLFLNVDRTAFVIGADPRIVRHAIAVRYRPEEIRDIESQGEANESKERLVTDYLEKLIQIPYRLPRLSPAEIETYMVLLFCLRDLDEKDATKCLIAYEKGLNKNRYSTFGYATIKEALGTEEVPKLLSKSLTFCAAVAPLITEGLKGNPRQVKRFLNAFMLRKELARIANLQNIKDDILGKLMVLEYGHLKEFYDLFEWQVTQDGFPKQIQELEKALLPPEGNVENEDDAKKVNQKWATKFMRKWITMEPRISNVDLRDYFWIARDRLQSSLTGLALVPPIVRRLFEDITSYSTPKRNVAVQSIKKIDEDEIVFLFDLITQHILRHPDQKNGFDALRALIENDIQGAPETLANTINKCLPESIPPAVGIDLVTLIQTKKELENIIQPELDRLSSTETKIGRAIKKHQTYREQ